MISKFFIERPVLANVLAILIVLIGGVALFACRSRNIRTLSAHRAGHDALPRRQRARPSSTPWRCRSSSRSTASRTCSTCSPTSASDGTYTLMVTFKIGTDLNFAQVLVQNRVASALASLPQSVQAQGVTVQKNRRRSCSS